MKIVNTFGMIIVEERPGEDSIFTTPLLRLPAAMRGCIYIFYWEFIAFTEKFEAREVFQLLTVFTRRAHIFYWVLMVFLSFFICF